MRRVCWFSCGVASAVAAKCALEDGPAEVVYCDTSQSEHPDNARFFSDVEAWLGVPIQRIANAKYGSVDEVFEKRRYMSGIAGAPCTVEMKKMPRFDFQRGDDTHIFGFTADEENRIVRLEQNNPELRLEWVLRARGITKSDCHRILEAAGISLPVMYGLGFKNNNCLGCVKATSPRYWNLTREHFPDVFAKRAQQSRDLGVRLTRYQGQRIYLNELPLAAGKQGRLEDVSCGPECAG